MNKTLQEIISGCRVVDSEFIIKLREIKILIDSLNDHFDNTSPNEVSKQESIADNIISNTFDQMMKKNKYEEMEDSKFLTRDSNSDIDFLNQKISSNSRNIRISRNIKQVKLIKEKK